MPDIFIVINFRKSFFSMGLYNCSYVFFEREMFLGSHKNKNIKAFVGQCSSPNCDLNRTLPIKLKSLDHEIHE